jgi:hypothetical protein
MNTPERKSPRNPETCCPRNYGTSDGGGDGIRTHCLYIANVALYQLSYTPEEVTTLAQRPAALRLAIPLVTRLGLVKL